METNSDSIFLTNDVLINILLRLPAKSLGRCKCVCKTWYNHIRNPNFIKNHFHHPENRTRLFSFYTQGKFLPNGSFTSDYVFALFTDDSLTLRQDIDNPLDSHGCLYTKILNVQGPVNGLYFMYYCHFNDESAALWNPSTSEFRELPLHSFRLPPNCFGVTNYFGFGATDEDVKLVWIHIFTRDENDIGYDNAVIAVYSLAHDCWRETEYDSLHFPYISSGIHHNTVAFTHFNGAYYWLVDTDRVILFLFDMRSEVFREVQLPPQHLLYDNNSERENFYMDSILVRDNSIALVVTQYSSSEDRVLERVHVWEMKEEGHWLKLCSFVPSSAYTSLDYPVGFWKKDEVCIQSKDGTKCVLYDIHRHETRNLGIDDALVVYVFNYKESLTSVRGVRDPGVALD